MEEVMYKDDCVFCKILKGNLPSKIVYENDFAKVIENIEPVAKVHLLIIPKDHTDNIKEYENNPELLGKLFNTAKEVSDKLKLDSYRLIVNVGEGAGQSVMHTHIHILSDEKLKDTFI